MKSSCVWLKGNGKAFTLPHLKSVSSKGDEKFEFEIGIANLKAVFAGTMQEYDRLVCLISNESSVPCWFQDIFVGSKQSWGLPSSDSMPVAFWFRVAVSES